LFAAGFFHPIQTVAVRWIVGRQKLLFFSRMRTNFGFSPLIISQTNIFFNL